MTNATMAAQWWAQNEATNEDGFLMNSEDDGDNVFRAEREALAEMGAPDTDSIRFESILAEDRDTARVVAFVTPALHEWLAHPDNEFLLEDIL
jgi:hypothetical protein